jgi:hypothetical protein
VSDQSVLFAKQMAGMRLVLERLAGLDGRELVRPQSPVGVPEAIALAASTSDAALEVMQETYERAVEALEMMAVALNVFEDAEAELRYRLEAGKP